MGEVNLKSKTMRYLITTKNEPPFLTKWFDPENNFNIESGMIVYDLSVNTYITDGINWQPLEVDHL